MTDELIFINENYTKSTGEMQKQIKLKVQQEKRLVKQLKWNVTQLQLIRTEN